MIRSFSEHICPSWPWNGLESHVNPEWWLVPIAMQKIVAARVTNNNCSLSYDLWIVFNVTWIDNPSIIERCRCRDPRRSFQFETFCIQKVKTKHQKQNQNLHFYMFSDKKLWMLAKQTFIRLSHCLFEKMHWQSNHRWAWRRLRHISWRSSHIQMWILQRNLRIWLMLQQSRNLNVTF